MIPLRVKLQGFMSYRDEEIFTFDGAPLWVIVGPNGAGKSAIFDAILFVLYDMHRGGGQNHTALINHAANGLNVEFDFLLGRAVYRAKRTLPKKGRGSWGIFDLSMTPERMVPATESKKGFGVWVAQHIGLDAQSFTASVLLQQGKSEALLTADPKTRHEILSQLVDISTYQNLADKANARQKRLEGEEETHAASLRELAPLSRMSISRSSSIRRSTGLKFYLLNSKPSTNKSARRIQSSQMSCSCQSHWGAIIS